MIISTGAVTTGPDADRYDPQALSRLTFPSYQTIVVWYDRPARSSAASQSA